MTRCSRNPLFLPTVGAACFLISLAVEQCQGASLSGMVIEDHSSVGLPSTSVRVFGVGAPGLVADIESNSAGRFDVRNLPSGEYVIEVSKANYIQTISRVSLTASESSISLITRLVRCGSISGRVLDANGEGLRGATVFAVTAGLVGGRFRRFADDRVGHEARVSPDGEYRLYNLPPGQFAVAVAYGASKIMVSSTGSASTASSGSGVSLYPSNSEPRTFAISGGEEYVDVDFSIAPSELYRISGRIDLTVTGDEVFWVALVADGQSPFASAVAQSDTSGAFRFEGVAPGSYTLLASGPSRSRSARGAVLSENPLYGRLPMQIGADRDDIMISMGRGRSVAFVLRAPKEPTGSCKSSSAELLLSPVEEWPASMDRLITVSVETSEVVENLAPSKYIIRPRDLGANCYAMIGSVDLTGPSSGQTVSVSMLPAGSIHGRLISDKTARTKFNVVLISSTETDSDSPIRMTEADQEQRFAFDGLRPGQYRIGVRPNSAEESGRWFADLHIMLEVDVQPGVSTDLEIPTPSTVGSQKE